MIKLRETQIKMENEYIQMTGRAKRMTYKHTPTPWEVHRNNSVAICSVKKDYDGDDTVIGFLETRGRINFPSIKSSPKFTTQEANAKHIVHCVNLHDELVEALTNCVHHLYPLLHNVEKSDTLDMRIRQAEKALKKAKGESHD